MRNRILWFAAAAAVLSCHCRRPPDEEHILRWLEQAIADCEQGLAREVSARLAPEFSLNGRRLHPLQLRRLIPLALSYTQGRRFYYPRPEINLPEDGDAAEVSFPFLLTGSGGGRSDRDAGQWLLDIADRTHLMRVHLRLGRDGDRWLVRDAGLKRFDGLEFRTMNIAADF